MTNSDTLFGWHLPCLLLHFTTSKHVQIQSTHINPNPSRSINPMYTHHTMNDRMVLHPHVTTMPQAYHHSHRYTLCVVCGVCHLFRTNNTHPQNQETSHPTLTLYSNDNNHWTIQQQQQQQHQQKQ